MSCHEHHEIVDMMVRYGQACDTKDWELLASCFVADAVVSYSSFGGELRGVGALERYLRGALDPLNATQHLFTNFLVDAEHERGHFRCLMQAQHVRMGTPGGDLFLVGGTYEVDVARVDGAWRMTRMDYAPSWMSGNAQVLAHIVEDEGPATVAPRLS